MNDDLQAKRELIRILDEVLAEGVWTGSLFLEASGEKIRDLRERLIKNFNLEQDLLSDPSTSVAAPADDTFPVYIALYQSAGQNIKKWETLLNAIDNFSSGRPIYKNEEDVQSFIRTKQNQQNDGYAVVYISEKDIVTLPANKQLFDRSGKELLTIKEGAIHPEKVVRFVHISGQYVLEKGTLVKDSG